MNSHMTFMPKECAWYQCSNNTSKWMAFVFIPCKPMKNGFGTTIITKSWCIKFVMKVVDIMVYPSCFSSSFLKKIIFSSLIHKILFLKLFYFILVLMKTTTSQIYKLHGFFPNPYEICYFINSNCFNTNVVHYLNTKVVCTIFVCKQQK
jgi:hypothetical protein